MLPQFNMDDFFSTSLFVFAFIFITYKFLQYTIIKYINNITLESENHLEEIEKNNKKMEEEIQISQEKINLIKNELKKAYEDSKYLMEKNYKENLVKINEELFIINKQKENTLQKKIEDEYKNNNISHILNHIKINLTKGNHDNN
jgi:F0F1-type ATP synthase membrane subunit b/b'